MAAKRFVLKAIRILRLMEAVEENVDLRSQLPSALATGASGQVRSGRPSVDGLESDDMDNDNVNELDGDSSLNMEDNKHESAAIQTLETMLGVVEGTGFAVVVNQDYDSASLSASTTGASGPEKSGSPSEVVRREPYLLIGGLGSNEDVSPPLSNTHQDKKEFKGACINKIATAIIFFLIIIVLLLIFVLNINTENGYNLFYNGHFA